MRRFACFLALVSGLVFASPAFAATYPDNGQAIAACLAQAGPYSGTQTNETSTHITVDTYSSKCVLGNRAAPNASLYKCVWKRDRVQTTKSNGQVLNFYYGGYCTNSAPTSSSPPHVIQGSGASAWYSSFVVPDTTGNLTDCNQTSNHCWATNTCLTKATFDSRTMMADTPNGSGFACFEGCRYSVAIGYIGTYPNGYLEFNWDPAGFGGPQVCAPTDAEAVPVPVDDGPEEVKQDQDGDGKKDDIDPCPNDPADTCNIPDDSKDTDGDGIPDYRDTHPNDATNGKDDGSGNETDNESSGGADCVTAPSCSGDAIQCNILYQSWAGRCGHTGTSGQTGGSNPGGDGDGTDLTPLTDRWDSTFGDGSFTGDNTSAIPGLSDRVSDLTIDSDSLDTSGLGLSRSCPAVLTTGVSFSVFGASHTLDFDIFCDLLDLVGSLLVVFSSFLAVRVLLGKS